MEASNDGNVVSVMLANDSDCLSCMSIMPVTVPSSAYSCPTPVLVNSSSDKELLVSIAEFSEESDGSQHCFLTEHLIHYLIHQLHLSHLLLYFSNYSSATATI